MLSHTFDIVLRDIQMPGMGGEEATRAIRAMSPLKNATPILALTADAMPEHRERYLAAGVNDLVTKPVDVNRPAYARLVAVATAGRFTRLLHHSGGRDPSSS